MSTSTLTPPPSRGPATRSELITLVMRMVVPLRHEFGKAINVERVLDDKAYALSVIELAHTSNSEQLRRYGEYLAAMIMGPRATAAFPPATAAAPQAVPAAMPAAEAPDPEFELLLAGRMGKYRGGLR